MSEQIQPQKKPRGFAVMDPEKHRELCRQGARALREQGKSHQFTSEEAVVAGRRARMADSELLREYARRATAARLRRIERVSPSAAERRVLLALARFPSNAAAAESLHLALRTVDRHSYNLRRRYSVQSTSQLLLFAAARGWLGDLRALADEIGSLPKEPRDS